MTSTRPTRCIRPRMRSRARRPSFALSSLVVVALLCCVLIDGASGEGLAQGANRIRSAEVARLGPVVNQPNVVTFNACGASHCPATGLAKADQWASIVLNRSPLPLAAAFQEVCRFGATGSYPRLQFWLGLGNGYVNHMRTTIPTGCGNNQFGIAIFWLGGCFGGNYPTSCVAQASYPAATTDQPRGYTCGRGGFPSFTACSTHLSRAVGNGNPVANSLAYWNATTFYSGITPIVFAAGDFNSSPAQNSHFYGNFVESDACSLICFNQPTYSNLKLDYIFASNRCRVANANVTPANLSDHHVLTGYFASC